MIVASIASIPYRREGLKKVVASILPQVQRLNVFLDDYPDVPLFLEEENIVVARSQDVGFWGDAGKFFWCDQIGSCYHFTLDDDILYPSDYVVNSVRRMESLPPCVASYTGHTLKLNSEGKIRVLYRHRHDDWHIFFKDVPQAHRVHVVGTGVCVYHTDSITLCPSMFHTPNMADLFLAVEALNQGVPRYVLPHPARWLRDNQKDKRGGPMIGKHAHGGSSNRVFNPVDVAEPLMMGTCWEIL